MKTIKQTVAIKAEPNEVYELIMDSKKHSAFTGGKAKISNKIGDKFTAYDDYIEGVNVTLVHGKKIVKKWRASDWADDQSSTITSECTTSKNGTKLKFTQVNVSYKFCKDIKRYKSRLD